MPTKLKENFFKFTLKMEIESPAQHSLVSSSLSTAAVSAVLLRNIWTESNSGLARSQVPTDSVLVSDNESMRYLPATTCHLVASPASLWSL